MKSKFYLGLMALAALSMSSCSKDQVVSQAPEANNAIAFDSYLGHAAQTKGQDITADNIEEFIVYGYRHNAINETPFVLDDANSEFMPRTVVSGSTDGGWTSNPVRYWPIDVEDTDYRMYFYAYSPDATKNTKVLSVIEEPAGVISGIPTVKYTLSQKVSEQVDLIWANAEDQKKTLVGDAAQPVSLTFGHALSKVTFKGKTNLDDASAKVKINEIGISSSLYKTVNVQLTDGNYADTPTAGEYIFEYTLPDAYLPYVAAGINQNKPANLMNEGSMYLIPEQENVVFNITNLKYTVELGGETKVYEFAAGNDALNTLKPTIVKLEKGKAYDIVLTITGKGDPDDPNDDIYAIDFTVNVTPWESASNTDVEF